MRLLLYTPRRPPGSRRLLKALHSLVVLHDLEHFDSLSALSRHLRQPIGTEAVAILWPADADELATLSRLRHLLRNMRIILILPDADPRTISDAHMLRPRFISFADGDWTDVAAVTGKILKSRSCNPLQAVH